MDWMVFFIGCCVVALLGLTISMLVVKKVNCDIEKMLEKEMAQLKGKKEDKGCVKQNDY